MLIGRSLFKNVSTSKNKNGCTEFPPILCVYIFSHALDSYLAVGILRLPEGLDYSNVIEDADDEKQMTGNSTTTGEAATAVTLLQDLTEKNETVFIISSLFWPMRMKL